jgi:hypothetical protein
VPGRPCLEVADIVRAHGQAYLRHHAVSADQRQVLRAIASCRTAALGGHVDVCSACGDEQPSYNSCRNRHCPKCQSLSQAKWIAERKARILPTHYFHVVFTLPAELRALALCNRHKVFDLLFQCASQALLTLGRDPKRLGAEIGITAVLHTWSSGFFYLRAWRAKGSAPRPTRRAAAPLCRGSRRAQGLGRFRREPHRRRCVIPALHSVQYLYVVWLLKRNEARENEGPPSFGRPTGLRLGILAASAIGLGWVLFRGAPAFLDSTLVLSTSDGEATTGLGETPYFAAIFVFVNIHHYFMDNVIWRRENPDTRYLLQLDEQGIASSFASPARVGEQPRRLFSAAPGRASTRHQVPQNVR